MRKIFVGLLIVSGLLAGDLVVTESGVRIMENGETAISSPEEGLWSIATDWKNAWPATWVHANPSSREEVNGWMILHGAMQIGGGKMILRDAYKPQGDVIRCVRRFTWTGKDSLKQATLSIRFISPGTGKGVCMPGICYYGNPSGEKSTFTPVYHGTPGEELLFEEHRYPMPFAALEWKTPASWQGAAMHTLPSPVPFANQQDQWWSLGVRALENGTEFTALTGPTAANGRRSVVKVYKQRDDVFAPYDDTWLDIPPGGIVEKTFYLQSYPVKEEGSGFQAATHTSIALFSPVVTPDLPSYEEILTQKIVYAKTRWIEGDGYCGFNQFDSQDKNFRKYIVWGWVGQAPAPGYAFQALRDELNDPVLQDMALRSLDFLCETTEFYEEGFYTWFDVENEKWGLRIWRKMPEFLSQGQGMNKVAKAIAVGRKQGADVSKWEAFLKKASDFHADRILSSSWNPKSTNDGFFMSPLAKAGALFGKSKYRQAAIKAANVYASRHLTMREPYWGGTLDARCEDKEGAFAALQGFLALYELTSDAKYLKWAQHACDVVLTYTVVWDIDLPPGRLRDHAFKTRGWTAVSVQNMHIDVYGVLIAPDIYKIGMYTENKKLKDLAILMYRTCGQLTDPWGSQGEQPQQTNYSQGQEADLVPISAFRGGYEETWTVFWITAHFLTAAADFKLMGAGF